MKNALIGISAGIISGMFASGGGLILVPIYTYIFKLEEKKARGTSLFCILPMVIVTAIMYSRNNLIDWPTGIKCAIGGTVGGLIGGKLLNVVPAKYLQIAFAIFLFYAGFSYDFLGKEVKKMIETLIGIAAGIVGGLGMGGGTILILFLSMFLGIEQHIAQATNIIFFVPTAIAAIIVSFRNKNIQLKLAIPICIWGIIGALVGSMIAIRLDVGLLKKIFGGFLILIAIYQTYSIYKEYRMNKKRHNKVRKQKGGNI